MNKDDILIEEIFVLYLNLPISVRGITKINDDDTYTVIINSRLTIENQRKAFLHEMQHIKRNDCYKYLEKAEDIERKIKP